MHESGHQCSNKSTSCFLPSHPGPTAHGAVQCSVCVCVYESYHRSHHLACGSRRRRRKRFATGLIDTSHFRVCCCAGNMEARDTRGKCKKQGKKRRRERWSGRMKRREQLEGRGAAQEGGRIVAKQAGQLIFYKPGLERS